MIQPDNLPIEALHLSPRCLNAIKKADLETVGDVLRYHKLGWVRGLRNIGTKGQAEIGRAVSAFRAGRHAPTVVEEIGPDSRSVDIHGDDPPPRPDDRTAAIEALPISVLLLEERSRRVLERGQITTVGQVLDGERAGWLPCVHGLGERGIADIHEALRSLLGKAADLPPEAIRELGDPRAPLVEVGDRVPVDLPALFPAILERMWGTLGNDRDREIFHRRYGLSGGTPCSFEDIGLHLGIVRERVRQLHERLLGRLRQVLLGRHVSREFHTPAVLVEETDQFLAYLTDVSFRPESDIRAYFERRYGHRVTPAGARYLPLLMMALGSSSTELRALGTRSQDRRVWHAPGYHRRKPLARIVESARSVIRKNPRGVSLQQIMAQVEKDDVGYVSADDLRQLLALLPEAEITPRGEYRLALQGRPALARRADGVVVEVGKPPQHRGITRRTKPAQVTNGPNGLSEDVATRVRGKASSHHSTRRGSHDHRPRNRPDVRD